MKRLDRDRIEAGIRRHRTVHALTLLQVEDNPSNRAWWWYLLVADALRRVSARTAGDLQELSCRIGSCAAALNINDHPRNHAPPTRSRRRQLTEAGLDWGFPDPANDPVVVRRQRILWRPAVLTLLRQEA